MLAASWISKLKQNVGLAGSRPKWSDVFDSAPSVSLIGPDIDIESEVWQ